MHSCCDTAHNQAAVVGSPVQMWLQAGESDSRALRIFCGSILPIDEAGIDEVGDILILELLDLRKILQDKRISDADQLTSVRASLMLT